jgi:integrase
MSKRFRRLTRANIRRLPVGSSVSENGIAAKHLPDGDSRYSVNIMVDGQRIHRVLGKESDGVTRTQCEEFIARARTDARRGRLGLPAKRKLALTLSSAADIYMERLKEAGGKNLVAKRQHLSLHIKPCVGTVRLDRLSTFTLERFRKQCVDRELSVATINRIRATYNHMARRLYEWKFVSEPLPLIAGQREDNQREYVLTHDEEDDLLRAALADSNTYLWLFIKIALATSMRHREVLRARFDSLDAGRRRLNTKVKGGRSRQQPLSKGTVQLLLREQEMAADPNGWVFPSSVTASGHLESMSGPFRRAAIGAGLNPKLVSPHTLRHTAITRLASQAVDFKTLQAFSGHLSIQALTRYMHPVDQKIDDALDAMSNLSTGNTASKRRAS